MKTIDRLTRLRKTTRSALLGTTWIQEQECGA
jgi:hypothetical protein